MVVFVRKVRQIADFLNLIAGWCLVAMTALTCADVVLRMFRRPILGTFEIVGFLGAAVASFAIAHTTIHRGHVAVEVLVTRLPAKAQVIIYVVTRILSIVLFAVLAYECVRFGTDLRKANEVSLTLRWPFYPVLYGISFSAVAVCFVLLVDLWKVLTGGAQAWYEWEE